jgi:HPt (histidine-containing phosphotransfer) domain-containing protein
MSGSFKSERRRAEDTSVPLDEGLIDEARVGSLGDQYGDLLSELVEIYATSTPDIFDALRVAVARDDAVGIRAAAHNLKGASQNVGATWIADVSRSIESDPSSAAASIDRLFDAFEPTLTRLRAIVA